MKSRGLPFMIFTMMLIMLSVILVFYLGHELKHVQQLKDAGVDYRAICVLGYSKNAGQFQNKTGLGWVMPNQSINDWTLFSEQEADDQGTFFAFFYSIFIMILFILFWKSL